MPQILYLPLAVPLSSAGSLLAGAKLYAYSTGSSTPLDTFSDYALTVPNANPVVADANGVFPVIFLSEGTLYRITLKTSADVTLPGYPIDDVGPDTATSLGAASLASANVFTATQKISNTEPRLIFDETDGGTDKRLWDIDVNSNVLSIRTRTDADGTGKDVLVATRGTTTALASIAIGNTSDLPAVTVNGVKIVDSGTFTGTLTGCTTSPTSTFYWRRNGSLVTIDMDVALLGTSNATTCTVTGVPAALTPARGQTFALNTVKDNGAQVLGGCSINGTTITLNNGIPIVNFTTSGSKGLLSGFSITYNLT